ncbi:CocE/NonD family hydrolase [Nannocystaceae bacterium ST9]
MSLRWPGSLSLSLSCSLLASLAACKGDDVGSDDEATSTGDTDETGEEFVFVDAQFSVRESVEQLHVTHAEPGVELRVIDSAGSELGRATTDELGSLIFRLLPPGEGYSVEETTGDEREASRDLAVMSIEASLPAQSFYAEQVLEPGYGYITTRDGTTLSIYVTLPGPIEDGPYPTIISYSGYEPSKPGGSLADQYDLGGLDLESLCPTFPVICDAPNSPEGVLGGFLGFATVGVNMRGTGCSGGAYDFFETLQILDGYDAIETIAAQDWVLGNKVAQTGLSYPGISQLWVAQSRPPSLAAITPMSIIANTADSTLRPGGIANDGFAYNWAENVLDGAVPYGKGWEQGLVDAGDTVCEENQLLHGQLVNVIDKADAHPYYEADIFDPLIPELFVDQIEVPVFVTGAWQDEQTGGHFPALYDDFSGVPHKKFTMFNGVHADGYVPENLIYWGAFLDFYLREEIPMISPELRNAGPLLFSALLGDGMEFPDDPYTGYASYDEAFAAFQAEAPIRIQFEVGNSTDYITGAPQSAWTLEFDQWPPAEIAAERWYLQADGTLATAVPTDGGGGSSWHVDPDDARTTTLDGDINTPLPPWNWLQEQPDTAAIFTSAELTSDLVMVGPASADLWIRSSVGEADVEVNISEVRPDGQEMYVQSGWLRASERAIDPTLATDLRPAHTHLEADLAPVPADEWVEARVEVFPFAHVFRIGSRIRISIDTPGSSRPEWKFILHDTQTADARLSVAHTGEAPSSILLPVIPDVVVPTTLPPCPSLRGQPCRAFEEFTNTPAE